MRYNEGYDIVTLVILTQAEPSTGLYGYISPPIAYARWPTEICMYVAGQYGVPTFPAL